MKILHISTKDLEGGSGRAANRLHQGLKKINIDSQMLVQTKVGDDETVAAPQTFGEKSLAKFGGIVDTIPTKFYLRHESISFSTQWLPDVIYPRVAQLQPDLIDLHWIHNSHLRIETLAKFTQPMVWTLHDMWAFTGGCHYDAYCGRYVESCGACPQLKSDRHWDLSRWTWQRKSQAWKNINLTIVTPSKWLAKCARSSSLFKNLRIETIPNGLDLQRYKPVERKVVRSLLNLPQNKQLLLFGAMNATSDRRKGFHLLEPALQRLCQSGWQDKIELVIVGASRSHDRADLGFKTHYLGKLHDDISLAQVYAAADVFVAPSLQDNLPNTVVEAISCGTPCVAFNIGGMSEIIEHYSNGYLARAYQIEDLAKGIAWVLEDKQRHQKLSDRARATAERQFAMELQASRYASLYDEIV